VRSVILNWHAIQKDDSALYLHAFTNYSFFQGKRNHQIESGNRKAKPKQHPFCFNGKRVRWVLMETGLLFDEVVFSTLCGHAAKYRSSSLSEEIEEPSEICTRSGDEPTRSSSLPIVHVLATVSCLYPQDFQHH